MYSIAVAVLSRVYRSVLQYCQSLQGRELCVEAKARVLPVRRFAFGFGYLIFMLH